MSGKETALKFDTGKVRMDLLDTEFLTEVAKVLTCGAEKYDAHNWRKGFPLSKPYAALQRHLTKWNSGEDLDPEFGLNHLAHAGCNIMFLLWLSKHKPELDDRFKQLELPGFERSLK